MLTPPNTPPTEPHPPQPSSSSMEGEGKEGAIVPYPSISGRGDRDVVVKVNLDSSSSIMGVGEEKDQVGVVPNLPLSSLQTLSLKDKEPTTTATQEGEEEDEEEEMDEGEEEELGCGYAVKISTEAYEVCLERGQIPFAAFFPVMSKKVYLLKIERRKNSGVQVLEPATKDDVFKSFVHHCNNGSGAVAGDRVPIVALLRQVYNGDKKAPEVMLEEPKASELPEELNLLSYEKFTTFAFSNVNLIGNQKHQSSAPEGSKTKKKKAPSSSKAEVDGVVINNDEDPPPPPPVKRAKKEKLPKEDKDKDTTKEKKKRGGGGGGGRGRGRGRGKAANKEDHQEESSKENVEEKEEETQPQPPEPEPETPPPEDKNEEGEKRCETPPPAAQGTGSEAQPEPPASSSIFQTPERHQITLINQHQIKIEPQEIEKEEGELDDDSLEEKPYHPSITDAPQRPPPISRMKRGRGRPRKLNFDNLVDPNNDPEKEQDEVAPPPPQVKVKEEQKEEGEAMETEEEDLLQEEKEKTPPPKKKTTKGKGRGRGRPRQDPMEDSREEEEASRRSKRKRVS